LPSRGEPFLRASAASRRDFLGALRRSLRGSVVATGVGIRLAIFCDALFGLVGELARALRLGRGFSRALIRFRRFFDQRQRCNGLVDVLARTILNRLPHFA
jgi:hypothetical protein